MCRGVRGRRVEIVPVSDSDSTEWHPSMVRSPPGFPAKPAFATGADGIVGGDAAKAAGNTVQDVATCIGAARTWAGVAAGPLLASHAVELQAEGSAAGAHPEHGADDCPAGEEDADFDDLLAGLTGGAAPEGAYSSDVAAGSAVTRISQVTGCAARHCQHSPAGWEEGHVLARGGRPRPYKDFCCAPAGCQGRGRYGGIPPACWHRNLFCGDTTTMSRWICWVIAVAVAADGGSASLAAAAGPGKPPALMSGLALHAAVARATIEASPAGEAGDSVLDDLDEAALRMAIEVLRLSVSRLCPLESGTAAEPVGCRRHKNAARRTRLIPDAAIIYSCFCIVCYALSLIHEWLLSSSKARQQCC